MLLLVTATLTLGGVARGALTSRGHPLVFDDFDYRVDREDTGAEAAFVTQGPWSVAKSQQDSPKAGGRLYTVSSIPDLQLPWPNGNARALCLETLAVDQQSDFYLQIGDGLTRNEIPGDVWFQWWHLSAATASQPSRIHARNKWLYPSNDGYGSHTNRWLIELGAFNYNPTMDAPHGDPSDGQQFISMRDAMAGTVKYAAADPSNQTKLGQVTTSAYIVPNQWNLVKIHIDTSSASSNVFEAWVRQYGKEWTKVAEWIGGTTRNFTWAQDDDGGGHSVLRWPTTIPGNYPGSNYDQWHYVQDFAMARTEEDLPTYQD
jgi:hypothetical protein